MAPMCRDYPSSPGCISVTDIILLDLYPLRIYYLGMTKKISKPPLTPAVLHILLALSSEERHGYGIMKQVQLDSQGKIKMGPGTLYGSIGRMIDAGLIRESGKKPDPEKDDTRRVYYTITPFGQEILGAELARYREVVAIARQRHLTEATFAQA